MIKAVFFDIDGTVLSHTTSSIPASALKAMQMLRDAGVRIFIATGRHRLELEELPLIDLQVDGYLTMNGSYCFNDEGPIFTNPLNIHDLQNLTSILNNVSFPVMFVEGDRLYMNMVNDLVYKVQSDIHSPVPDIHEIDLSSPVYQLSIYGLSASEEIQLDQVMPHCKQTRWHQDAIDVIPLNGGKQAGIQAVLDHYGILQEETMAFGDGENDVDMIRFCHIGIAMGNGVDNLKKCSDEITEDIDDDGLYKAIQRHFEKGSFN